MSITEQMYFSICKQHAILNSLKQKEQHLIYLKKYIRVILRNKKIQKSQKYLLNFFE